ncbi:MAG: hypothetical protein R3F30_08090 [Planctomycetota bacterium]
MGESRPRLALDALLVTLVALGLYLAFGHELFFKFDGQHLVLRLVGRDPHYPRHVLYMPLLIAFGDLCDHVVRLSPYEKTRALSAVGTAIAAGSVVLGAGLLGLGRGRRLAAGLAFALCPAVFLFGTVVEIHGAFLGVAGPAFVLACALGRPRADRAVELVLALAFGGLCGLATLVHASGFLLPGLLLPWVLVRRWGTGPLALLRREDRAEGLGRSGLLLAAAMLPHLLLSLWLGDVFGAADFVGEGFRHPQGLGYLPGIVWAEGLLPFLPLSLVAALCLLRPGAPRREALALGLGVAPYLWSALRLLVGDTEFGAYLLPAALVAACLAATYLPRRLLPVLVVLCAVGAGLAWRWQAGATERYRVLAADWDRALGPDQDRSIVILADPEALGAILVHLPGVRIFPADEPAKYDGDAVRRDFWPPVEAGIRDELARRQRVFVTPGALAFWTSPVSDPRGGGHAFAALLEATFRLEDRSTPAVPLREVLPRD